MAKVDTRILNNVKRAMQAAEEMDGPEGNDYVATMAAIAAEANRRIANFAGKRPRSRPVGSRRKTVARR